MEESRGHVLDADQLRAFVASARKRAIDVWVVEGGPHAAMPTRQQQFTRRVQLMQQNNEAIESKEREKNAVTKILKRKRLDSLLARLLVVPAEAGPNLLEWI